MAIFFRNLLILIFLSLVLFSSSAVASDKLKIGFILPLTGQWAEFGEAQRNALEFAKEKTPSLFNKVEFIYEDCQYISQNVVTAFHKLRVEDKVDLFYVWGVEPALVASKLAEQFQVPMLISAQLSKKHGESRFIFRTINYAEQYSEKIVQYFRSRNFKNIGVIKTEISFYNDRINGIKELLKPDEKLEVVYELNPGETDFKTIVASLKVKKNFDILGLYLTSPQLINFFKTSQVQNFKSLTFGSTPFESKRLISLTNKAIIGSLYEHNDTFVKFHEEYLKKFSKDDQVAWAANAYDVANLLGAVSTGKSDIEGIQILDYFRKAPSIQGAGGNYKVDYQSGVGYYFNYPIVIKSVSNDGFDVIYR